MGIEKERILLTVFGAVFLFSIFMLASEDIVGSFSFGDGITGYATEGSTTSNVTISKYLSITMSTNLSNGITFGSVQNLPAVNLNATHNNDSAGGTSMYVNVSTDSNTNVDFCIRADGAMTSPSLDTIGVGNESYANASTTDAGTPALASEVSLTTGYVSAGKNVSIGGLQYYRVWLDIPSGTPSGTYNNTVYFKGVEAGVVC
jgi:hypothetical protein